MVTRTRLKINLYVHCQFSPPPPQKVTLPHLQSGSNVLSKGGKFIGEASLGSGLQQVRKL